MTAVDHAELKRVAEGATPGPWTAADWDDDFGENKFTVQATEPEKLSPGQSSIWPDGVRCLRVAETLEGERPTEDAAFIAAANPAVVLALLSEIEGLKAKAMLADLMSAKLERRTRLLDEAERTIFALRTQAPDSWRPIETAPKDGETVLIFTPRTYPQVTAASYRDDCAAEHWQAVWHRWHWPADVTHWMPLPAAPALRPQTAESGK